MNNTKLVDKAKNTLTGMKQRCYNVNYNGYKKYGARGIKICERWNKFENFLEDIGLPPSLEHSIDRINPFGNYEPSNCRWATQKTQQNNRTNNHRYKFQDKNLTLIEWSDHTGIARKTLFNRIKRGWPLERVFTEKAIKGRNQSHDVLITFNGKSQSIRAWAKEIGINESTLQCRLNRQYWPVERALTEGLVIGRPR